MSEEEKSIAQRLAELMAIHLRKYHGAKSVRPWMMDGLVPPTYTNSSRPSASSVDAGTIIYNSDDAGLNVSDGTNWRGPEGGWVNT